MASSAGSDAENAANGTAVGITAHVSDSDLGATISYPSFPTRRSSDLIGASSGIVTVADGTLLDAESSTSHNITVLATSSDGSTNSTTFAVAIGSAHV